jgi:hypothetical protein
MQGKVNLSFSVALVNGASGKLILTFPSSVSQTQTSLLDAFLTSKHGKLRWGVCMCVGFILQISLL